MDREEIKSIKSMIELSIQKGIVDESFSSSIKIEKNGSEVKEKIKSNLIQSILKKNDLFRVLEQLADQIGELPQGVLDKWELSGMRDRLMTIPYKYDYSQLYGVGTVDEMKSKYNSKLMEYIEVSIDCLLFKTIIDNIDDKKIYQLNIQNATQLGF
jgi:hypothetical protein